MFARYPVLLLFALSAAGTTTAVALLFTDSWLALAAFATSALCLIGVVTWLIRRGDAG